MMCYIATHTKNGEAWYFFCPHYILNNLLSYYLVKQWTFQNGRMIIVITWRKSKSKCLITHVVYELHFTINAIAMLNILWDYTHPAYLTVNIIQYYFLRKSLCNKLYHTCGL